eukprot:m.244364 g.244364  ORF g.244364 m.244364 type:complete len:437 (+) comp54460_c0_seq5:500-1810(+)
MPKGSVAASRARLLLADLQRRAVYSRTHGIAQIFDGIRPLLWLRCQLHPGLQAIHRDIKPENVLISTEGVLKLCDFGFARYAPAPGELQTGYVATRWYRSPELIVGDPSYDKAVDVWALGCLFFEMLTSQPLLPGNSDLDQLYHIMRCFGKLPQRYSDLFHRHADFSRARLPEPRETVSLRLRLRVPTLLYTMDLLEGTLRLDASERLTSAQVFSHQYFAHDGFAAHYSSVSSRKAASSESTAPARKPSLSLSQASSSTSPTSTPPPLRASAAVLPASSTPPTQRGFAPHPPPGSSPPTQRAFAPHPPQGSSPPARRASAGLPKQVDLQPPGTIIASTGTILLTRKSTSNNTRPPISGELPPLVPASSPPSSSTPMFPTPTASPAATSSGEQLDARARSSLAAQGSSPQAVTLPRVVKPPGRGFLASLFPSLRRDK